MILLVINNKISPARLADVSIFEFVAAPLIVMFRAQITIGLGVIQGQSNTPNINERLRNFGSHFVYFVVWSCLHFKGITKGLIDYL